MSEQPREVPRSPDRLAKAPEVAAFLGVSPTTVWRLVRDNDIPHIPLRAGRKTIRFCMDDIRQWVREKTKK